jgi:hypothetical protein
VKGERGGRLIFSRNTRSHPGAFSWASRLVEWVVQYRISAEYIKAPVVTRRRIYIETLQDVMPGIRSKIIVDEQTRSILPLLNLDSQKGERP